jgi:hypothetical protein
MKKLILTAVVLLSAMTTAHACGPPEDGDKFQLADGKIIELVTPRGHGLNCDWEKHKACFRPAGTNQPCRWINFPVEGPAGKWIVLYGVNQAE